MYYAKYIKYKNKYLNLKYQLGGNFDTILIQKSKSNIIIPDELKTIEQIQETRKSLENNLIGIKVLYQQNIKKLLLPLVEYNKKFNNRPIYFYRYTDKSNSSSSSIYILCSLYNYWEILNKLQKKNVRIERINIDENGNVSLKLVKITIPEVFKKVKIEDVDKNKILKNLKEDLVGVKILETDKKLLKDLKEKLKDFKKLNKIYYYRYTDKGISYILLSLYDYYEFLDILYEHIEIEEVNIDVNEVTTLVETDKIYHIIPKPDNGVPNKTITLPIENTEISLLSDLIGTLSCNLFVITNNEYILPTICMYNLFIGTIHVYVIYIDNLKSAYFLLSLFTQHELEQKGISKPVNVTIKECRLYKQGDKIDFKLNEDFVGMMFDIYDRLRNEGHYANKLYRGNPAIDNLFLNELDTKLLVKCRECISVKDIAFNTTLCLLPDKIGAKDHKDILEMEKDFLKNSFELINSNEKLYLWRYKYEDLIQLWEYSLEDLGNEVKKFKEELLGLEPCHQELLVLKLNEKGFAGRNMDEILQNSALCYLNREDENKRLLYENTVQKEQIDNQFVRNCKFIPDMRKLFEIKDSGGNIESELHKYRQTILFLRNDTEIEKKYKNNQLYFFIDSFYILRNNINLDKSFIPLAWTAKLNKLCFQCLALRDWLIFPIRIVNIQYLKSPLSYEFSFDKHEFCGYFHTRFTDNFNGNNDFKIECRDKLYFIYYNTKKQINYKQYQLFYYTGNPIWLEVSMLPYYKISLCEINWIYYTFILKYKTIPHFYEFINDNCEIEIVVSRFSLDEIKDKYKANGYNNLELNELKEIFYNNKFNDIRNKTFAVFVDSPIYKTDIEKNEFIRKVIFRNKNRVK